MQFRTVRVCFRGAASEDSCWSGFAAADALRRWAAPARLVWARDGMGWWAAESISDLDGHDEPSDVVGRVVVESPALSFCSPFGIGIAVLAGQACNKKTQM